MRAHGPASSPERAGPAGPERSGHGELAALELGLSDREVARRRGEGAVNDDTAAVGRTVREIVRANVFTRFNAILGVLLAVIMVVGPLQDALFGIVLVTNTLIGIVQELKAKRSLDRLLLLTAPRSRVRRNGETMDLAVTDVVQDDVLLLEAGDQLVVDGVVLHARGLEVDESLLSGEAEPVGKRPGHEVLSGSFVVAGTGVMRATRVGRHAYARALADEARAFQLVRSELRAGINLILRMVTWLLLPAAVLLVSSQLVSHESLPEAVRGSVAGVGSMVPEGLVLLTSVAFAAGVVRLARRRVLVQELAAIEVLARVDVVCVDKTGTLTEPELGVSDVLPLGGHRGEELGAVLATLAATEAHPNATLRAVAAAAPPMPSPGVVVRDAVPFSSARKWSAADLGPDGAWVLGAPDVLLRGRPDQAQVARQADALAATGRRGVLLARAPAGLRGDHLPDPLVPAALVALEEQIRPDAPATLRYFAAQGVTVKVLSGDHPATVAAVARRVGLDPGAVPVDARDLPTTPGDLADALDAGTVFGRVDPHQKRAMVAALRARGHVVAMTGDGVNDVLALKEADLGVAMASGSAASRAVAPVVLLDNSFAALPEVVAEGRRVIANVERVANLFVTKTVYALLLALAVGVARLPFPFLPRHLTIVSSLTIGIPAFFLALAPNDRRARPGFVARVLRFALPAGAVAAAATFTGYALARSQPGISLDEARTTATGVLFAVGVWVLSILARPLNHARRALLGAMVGAFVVVLAIPAAREFFALDFPSVVVAFAAAGVVAIADVALEAGWRVARWPVWARWFGHPEGPD